MNKPVADRLSGKTTRKGKTIAWRHQPLLAQDPLEAWQGLLKARSLKETDKFFAPALSDLPDPFLMQDMSKAAIRLMQAIQDKEKIHVFGDFDCDGVSGTCILVEALRAAGADVAYSIPHRADDGHGIGADVVQDAFAQGAKLGLSVDTGTTCFEACRRASELGFDLIVTDHHLPNETLPDAFALLNPARADCGFADRVLCGTGVAFFLLMAVWKLLADEGQKPAYDLRQLLDRVAMATVADVMKLQGVNRVLVHHGLKQLKTNPSVGMSALLSIAKVNREKISVDTIGFYLAPRINAAGRMQHGEDAMKLLCCQDELQAQAYAEILDGFNQERRKVEATTYKEAVEKLKLSAAPDVLAVYDKAWHAGVVGLAAGRLARQHGRPAAVGFVDADNRIRVSLRGVKGFHIGNLLNDCAAHLEGFGGHAGAGGGSIKDGAWSDFVQAFATAVHKQQDGEGNHQALDIDGLLSLSALHIGLATRLTRFEPIGQGNPGCLWLLDAVSIVDIKKLKGGVIRLQLNDGESFMSAVAFRGAQLFEGVEAGVCVSLVGQLQKDDYRGGDEVQFVVEDILV